MIKICLIGASGKMGRAVIEEANNYNDIEITNYIVHENSKALNQDVGKFHFEKADNKIFTASINGNLDCIIDFATRENIQDRIILYAKLKKPVLFCTTGLNSNELELGKGFDLKHSRAKNLYIGKTVLCGDAANTFHPMAGQGLNLGIGDIMQLDETLDQIISGDMQALSNYNKKRNSKNIQMTWIIQSIFGAFGNAEGISEKILNSGMKFLNKIPDLKEKIVDYANKN